MKNPGSGSPDSSSTKTVRDFLAGNSQIAEQDHTQAKDRSYRENNYLLSEFAPSLLRVCSLFALSLFPFFYIALFVLAGP